MFSHLVVLLFPISSVGVPVAPYSGQHFDSHFNKFIPAAMQRASPIFHYAGSFGKWCWRGGNALKEASRWATRLSRWTGEPHVGCSGHLGLLLGAPALSCVR